MRVPPALAMVALTLLAGCTDGADAGGAGGAGGDGDVDLAPGLGGIAGVVVDQAIRPVADATVQVTGANVERSAETGEDGAFRFADLQPGTYQLRVEHLLYAAAQSVVEVRADEVASTKVLVERLFTQDPYHETLKFDGFIQCGYSVSGALSSVCVNDYTHFVGPYTCPECEHLFDKRSHDFAVGAGWQTMVYEMTWDPSAQGTSPEMRLIISHFPRPASHWYCSGNGPDPVHIRMDLNVTCEDQQDEPEQVPPEGLPNMHMFAATSAPEGQPASAAFSQPFSVFMNFFYYGKAPADWSFIRGDPYPF
jgi:hypothetical protein